MQIIKKFLIIIGVWFLFSAIFIFILLRLEANNENKKDNQINEITKKVEQLVEENNKKELARKQKIVENKEIEKNGDELVEEIDILIDSIELAEADVVE